MKCDIIIPVWNQKDITRDCIESIVRNTGYPYALILIDNASDAETRTYLESVRADRSLDVTLIRNEENLGFVKAVNQGLKASRSPYVCIMNNDTVATPGWLNEMVEFADANKDIGIINPLCGGPAGIPKDEYARTIAKSNKNRYMEMNQCFLYCALMRRDVMEKVGYLDEVFGMGGYDDTDYSMRMGRAGYRCVCLHSAYVHHLDGTSFKVLGNREKMIEQCRQEYLKKWPGHLRVGIAFSLSGKVKDDEIAEMMKGILFLAREWCWLNLWIFGDAQESKKRIESASIRIAMPVHQNIKFNYFPHRFKNIRVLSRLIERSFGTKKRKRYDAVIIDDERAGRFLKLFSVIHRNRVWSIGPGDDMADRMCLMLSEMRSKKSA